MTLLLAFLVGFLLSGTSGLCIFLEALWEGKLLLLKIFFDKILFPIET